MAGITIAAVEMLVRGEGDGQGKEPTEILAASAPDEPNRVCPVARASAATVQPVQTTDNTANTGNSTDHSG